MLSQVRSHGAERSEALVIDAETFPVVASRYGRPVIGTFLAQVNNTAITQYLQRWICSFE